jgi:hypothetical protein
MLDGSRVGLFKSHVAREAKMAFLRQKLLSSEAIRAGKARATECRLADFRLAQSAVSLAARSHSHLQVRDAGALASGQLRVGRSAVQAEIRDLVRTMSWDNPLWGSPGIHGELLKP